MFAHPVAESGELRDVLRIAHEALVYRVHGVLEGERALELSRLYLEERQLLPFYEYVDKPRTVTKRCGVAVGLTLYFVGKIVKYASVERETDHPKTERIAFSTLLAAVLVLPYGITAELGFAEDFCIILRANACR